MKRTTYVLKLIVSAYLSGAGRLPEPMAYAFFGWMLVLLMIASLLDALDW